MKTTIDTIAAQELHLFASNDSETYFRSLIPVMENMTKKQRKGTFDSSKAVKAFQYPADLAARRYCDEFGGVYHQVFNAATRREVASMLLDDYLSGSLE